MINSYLVQPFTGTVHIYFGNYCCSPSPCFELPIEIKLVPTPTLHLCVYPTAAVAQHLSPYAVPSLWGPCNHVLSPQAAAVACCSHIAWGCVMVALMHAGSRRLPAPPLRTSVIRTEWPLLQGHLYHYDTLSGLAVAMLATWPPRLKDSSMCWQSPPQFEESGLWIVVLQILVQDGAVSLLVLGCHHLHCNSQDALHILS